MATCKFNTLRERDMDLMILEIVVSDNDFVRDKLINAANLSCNEFEVENIELSNYDWELGESDITAIIRIDGVRYGFLIEDKIDAAAMPEQYERYVARAEKTKAEGKYDDYRVFIFCSDTYREANSEAAKYPYHLSYEKCLDYFKGKDDPISKLRVQQLEQAIHKAKSSDIKINENANAFFKAYAAYKDEHYPDLKLTTKLDKNGYWPQYKAAFKGAYILHKFNFGYVDLQINNAAVKIETVEKIVGWLKTHGCNVEAVGKKGVKSAVIRCRTQPIEISKNHFEDVSETIVEDWFKAIKMLAEVAALFENIRRIVSA